MLVTRKLRLDCDWNYFLTTLSSLLNSSSLCVIIFLCTETSPGSVNLLWRRLSLFFFFPIICDVFIVFVYNCKLVLGVRIALTIHTYRVWSLLLTYPSINGADCRDWFTYKTNLGIGSSNNPRNFYKSRTQLGAFTFRQVNINWSPMTESNRRLFVTNEE